MPHKSFEVLVVALAVSASAGAADLQKVTFETQRMARDSNQLTIVWWAPTAFWQESVKGNLLLTAEGIAKMVDALDQYTIFFVERASIGLGGSVDASSREELLNNSKFEINGITVVPLAIADVKPDGQAILAAVKPIFANMLGGFGQGLQMVLYPGMQGGHRLLDPMKHGSFSYTLYDKSFKWRLPLGSLLPPKVDPRTNDEFPGDYDYNPYTGGKLRQAK